MKTKTNNKIPTYDSGGNINGHLIPIYNIHDKFHNKGQEPKQVYLTVVKKGCTKGPHLHNIRAGYFTCIKGNVRIVVKQNGCYTEFYSGECHNYRSVIIPAGVPAAVQNIGEEDAFVLNMPSPAWTPSMNDEHTADFSDYSFSDE